MILFKPKPFEKENEVIKFGSVKYNSQLNPRKYLQHEKKRKNNRKGKKGVANEKGDHDNLNIKRKVLRKVLRDGRVSGIEKAKNKQRKQLKQSAAIKETLKDVLKEPTLKLNSNNDNKSLVTNMKSSQQIKEFETKLQTRLLGGRFRYINEQLYTMRSYEAERLFKEDPTAFQAYHEGYKQQLKKWPVNPLQCIIKSIKRYPKFFEIGDFGCGDGQLAKSVPNKVYSFDLISLHPHVIACDIINTPINRESLDIAVYCLSLMGTNLNDFILEANRVLKLNGVLIIAEIQKRFENVKQFTRNLESYGFHLFKQDIIKDFFYLFQFKKTRHVGKVAIVQDLILKPCIYKKR